MLLFWLTAASPPALAVVQPMNCAQSPFGPPDADGYLTIPYSITSRRFPWDQGDPNNYVNNVDYSWQMWFSGNVTAARLVFPPGQAMQPGFSTQQDFDSLSVQYLTLSGPLDQGQGYVSPPVGFPGLIDFPNDNYWNLQWYTDHSFADVGWTVSAVRVFCGWSDRPAGSASAVSRLHPNGQRDGVLLGTGDIRYFSTILPADRAVLLFLKPDGPPTPGVGHADYDLYASLQTATPSPGDADWSSTRGLAANGAMLDDTLLILPTGVDRYLFFSVYGFTEDPQNPGGYRVYDNVVGRMFELKAGASFDFVNGPNGNQTANIEASLYATTGGLYEATDGTALITKWQVWNNDAMCGGEGCQMVFDWAPCPPLMPCANDDCPTVACNSNTPVLNRTWSRASGSGAPNGYRMAHELGHCQYGMHDEYVAGGNVCGHGIMNGPIGGINVADYCSGHRAECPQGPIFPNGNHNSDCQGVAPGTVATDPEGGWTMIQTCRPDQVVHFLPTGVPATPDPERFLFSDVWKVRNHSVMERQNY